MGAQISVFTSKELQLTLVALKGMDKELSAQVRRAVKTISTPQWKQVVSANVRTHPQQTVLANTATVSVSNTTLKLRSANSVRKLRGGASPADLAKAIEFGADTGRAVTYVRVSPKGARHNVTRHTTRQLSRPSRTGWAVYPGAAEIIPRVAAIYAQTTLRTFAETIEKGGR